MSILQVLHPKNSHHFRVEFFRDDLLIAKSLSTQIVDTTLPAFKLIKHVESTVEADIYQLDNFNSIVMAFEDDVEEKANSALYDLLTDLFSVRISHLNGQDQVTSYYTLKNAVLSVVESTTLSYASDRGRSATLRFPAWFKSDLSAEALEVQKFLSGVSIDFNDAPPHSGKVMKYVSIDGGILTHTIIKTAPK